MNMNDKLILQVRDIGKLKSAAREIDSSGNRISYYSTDLYITYYDEQINKWSIPQDLGKPINSRAQERFPYVSPDGKFLFFTLGQRKMTKMFIG